MHDDAAPQLTSDGLRLRTKRDMVRAIRKALPCDLREAERRGCFTMWPTHVGGKFEGHKVRLYMRHHRRKDVEQAPDAPAHRVIHKRIGEGDDQHGYVFYPNAIRTVVNVIAGLVAAHREAEAIAAAEAADKAEQLAAHKGTIAGMFPNSFVTTPKLPREYAGHPFVRVVLPGGNRLFVYRRARSGRYGLAFDPAADIDVEKLKAIVALVSARDP